MSTDPLSLDETNQEDLPPGLYLVATPLGNLSDLSERARETLSRASFIAGESSKAVLRWLEILGPWEGPRPGVLTYRESSKAADERRILELLGEGRSIAVISDAGTPCISDPGWQLVDAARREGHQVWPIPGACAAVAALSVSGFPSRHFRFEGFLPSSGRARRECLRRVAESECPVILYESPHDLLTTLEDLASLDPEREIFVSREMTKYFEESWRGSLANAVTDWSEKTLKGEFTLVLGPRTAEDKKATELPADTLELVKSLGLPTKQASRLLHHFFPGLSKKELYAILTPK